MLENFFGVIRCKGGLHGCDGYPNSLEFRYRLRSYLLGNNEGGGYSEYSNVEVDDTPSLPMSGSTIRQLNSNDDTIYNRIPENDAPDLDALNELAYDGLEHLASFICSELNDPNLEQPNQTSYTWTSHLSEQGSHVPSDNFMKDMEKLDTLFREFNGDDLKITKNYLQTLASMSENITCPEKAKKMFFRSRLSVRIKDLNKRPPARLRKRKIVKIVS